jgi:hypothetical protein
MTNPPVRIARMLLIATPLVLAVTLNGSAESGADVGFEPLISHGPSLDRSMTALNGTIQDQYAKERLLARLVQPVSDEERFQTVAAASDDTSGAAFRMIGASGFGPVVIDDSSLESNLAALNEDLHLRGDVFMTMANNGSNSGASVSGAEFDYAAAILSGVLRAEARRAATYSSQSAFGTLVRDGASLDSTIVSLNDEIQRRESQEGMLAGSEMPEVTGTSFTVVAQALAIGFQ